MPETLISIKIKPTHFEKSLIKMSWSFYERYYFFVKKFDQNGLLFSIFKFSIRVDYFLPLLLHKSVLITIN